MTERFEELGADLKTGKVRVWIGLGEVRLFQRAAVDLPGVVCGAGRSRGDDRLNGENGRAEPGEDGT